MGTPGKPQILHQDGLQIGISYGSAERQLPFSIKLYDFIMERYPGTNSAASFASEVQLIDQKKNHQEDYRIYMNHILDYQGYRFFQSSYDKDEKGTYLSVNYDFWGTWVSYLGYALLTIGMALTFFSKKTRFYKVQQKIQKLRKESAVLILLLLFTSLSPQVRAEGTSSAAVPLISSDHAQRFSELVVQDFKGRMKPVHTLPGRFFGKSIAKKALRE